MKIISLSDCPEMKDAMADWFHAKWEIDREAYINSMNECLEGKTPYPAWYIAIEDGLIAGGIGVIENDFHCRKDLFPNVCALYTEETYRGRGIAGALIDRVCCDMKEKKIHVLYLITDHTSFYERYGWQYLCEVEEDCGGTARMYVRYLE